MENAIIYKKVEQYVTGLFHEEQNPLIVFHNLEHTEYVVRKASEIAGHYQLSEKDMLVVFIAAWFHDTGYLQAPAHLHEQKSVEMMKHFAQENNLPADIITEVEDCILATARNKEPVGLLQEIICDADTYNFGTKDFKKTNKQVYTEWKNFNPSLLKQTFDLGAINLLDSHRYYTNYCKEQLQENKIKNMKKLTNKTEVKAEKKNGDKAFKHHTQQEEENKTLSEKAGTTKGMQTMLRLTSSNHIQLSEMADSKANILISVNAIIISVILSVLLRKLQTDPYLTIPTLIFLSSSVITIVIAILATRPKLNEGTFSSEDVNNKKTNLLFFGNFHKMQLKEYEDAMRVMMTDADYLYSSMVQDIYHLGTVLGRKYRLIRLAYTIFMVGIVVSVIAFALASILYVPPPAAAHSNTTGSPF